MRHIASTYSGAQPQSLLMVVLPRRSFSVLPCAILQAAETILRVTKRPGRSGDSWLKRMPLQANSPYASR